MMAASVQTSAWDALKTVFARSVDPTEYTPVVALLILSALVIARRARGGQLINHLDTTKLSHRIVRRMIFYDVDLKAQADRIGGEMHSLYTMRFIGKTLVRGLSIGLLTYLSLMFVGGRGQCITFPEISRALGRPATPYEARWMNIMMS